VFNPEAVDPTYGGYYLAADLYGSNANNGASGCYTPLGAAAIPAGTTGGSVPEFWMQYDFKNNGGAGGYSAALGAFNSDGDNDRIPGFSFILLENEYRGRTVFQARNVGGWVNSSIIYADGTAAYRVKAHVYNSGGTTSIDVSMYGFDPATHELYLIGSIAPAVILGTGITFDYGMDVFGVKNGLIAPGPTVHAVINYDNMYFSNVGEYIGSDVPAWIPEPATFAILTLGSLMMIIRRK
jgi:hypothetical protein